MGKSRLLAAVEPTARPPAGSPGPGPRTCPTAAASPTARRACSRRPSPTSTASTRARSPAGSCSPTTSTGRPARRFGGAIAAIARDAAFSGWEAEAADMPADPAEVDGDPARRRRAATSTVCWTRPDHASSSSTTSTGSTLPAWAWSTCSSSARPATRSRPRRHPARPTLPAWVDRADVTRLDLDGLAEPETARLATLVARAAVDADGARSIHERTGGNPLFVGETVRAFLEDGTLERRDGRVALSSRRRRACRSRCARCSGRASTGSTADAREALGVASVIGIAFRHEDVEQLLDRPLDRDAPRPARGQRAHRAAERRRRGGSRTPLIHDAAYAGLLAQPPARPPRPAGRPARAGRRRARPSGRSPPIAPPPATPARAIPLLREAAERALTLGAAAEAAAFWRQAADLADAERSRPAPRPIGLGRRAVAAVDGCARWRSIGAVRRQLAGPPAGPAGGAASRRSERSASVRAGLTVTASPSTAGRTDEPGRRAQGVELGPPGRPVVDEHRRRGPRPRAPARSPPPAVRWPRSASSMRGDVERGSRRAAGRRRASPSATDVDGPVSPVYAEARAVGRLDDDAPRRDVVAAADEAERAGHRSQRRVRVVLDRVERGIEEPVALARPPIARASSRARPPGGRWIGSGTGAGSPHG